MVNEKFNTSYAEFTNALNKLMEAINEDVNKSSLIIDGTIQRFEFTFELAWKLLKVFLDYEGISCNSPRICLKEAYKFGIITDEEGWISLMEDRNLTSHIYNENTAVQIYQRIKSAHYKLLDSLKTELKKYST